MLTKIKIFLLELFFPSFCVSCGKDGSYLCKKCVKEVQLKQFHKCPVCGKKSDFGIVCCNKDFYLKGILSSTYYKDLVVQKAIKIFKYNFSQELVFGLAEILTRQLKRFFRNFLLNNFNHFVFVPVPLHKKRYKWRGFNQSELLSIYLAEQFKTLSVNLLKKIKNTKAQAKLSKESRLCNLKNAFQIQDIEIKIPRNSTIFLVDDVVTTGTTLKECAKILYNNGYKNIYGLTVCG